MRDNDDRYDEIEARLNYFIGPKLIALPVICSIGLLLINELLWGIVTAIGFVFSTGFFIARFILNIQERMNLVIVSVTIGSNILAFCWLVHKIL